MVLAYTDVQGSVLEVIADNSATIHDLFTLH